jgi:ribonuclease HI
MAKKKFYVVWKGRKPGIFSSWDECKAQVDGFAGAEYKSFESLSEAKEAFKGEYDHYKTVKGQSQAAVADRQALIRAGKIIVPSFAVDAACSGSPGPVEYRGVNIETGSEVFRQGPFKNGTNNIGEFLAIVHALAEFKQQGIASTIYSDSRNALAWVKAKKCRTTLAPEKTSPELLSRITRAEQWLRANTYANPLLKWESDDWGENPADFGRK